MQALAEHDDGDPALFERPSCFGEPPRRILPRAGRITVHYDFQTILLRDCLKIFGRLASLFIFTLLRLARAFNRSSSLPNSHCGAPLR